jgi:chromosomal replication initiation ATPase DnaA
VAKLYQIDPEVILSKGRQKKQVEARDLFCYVAVHELRAPVTDLARLIGMTPTAISYATMRGKVIADRKAGMREGPNQLSKLSGDTTGYGQWAIGDRKCQKTKQKWMGVTA